MGQEAEEARRMLYPYIVPSPKRGIIGNSRYAIRLRKDIVAASRDPDRYLALRTALRSVVLCLS